MNSVDQLTPAAILEQARSQQPSTIESIHNLLRELDFEYAANALSEEADIQLQHLAEVMANLHTPDARQNVLQLILGVAGTAANMAYFKGRGEQKAEDAPLLGSPLDRWIKVTPSTLPLPGCVVHAWIASHGWSERAFYSPESRKWYSAPIGAAYSDGAVTYYRTGSRPLEEGGPS